MALQISKMLGSSIFPECYVKVSVISTGVPTKVLVEYFPTSALREANRTAMQVEVLDCYLVDGDARPVLEQVYSHLKGCYPQFANAVDV